MPKLLYLDYSICAKAGCFATSRERRDDKRPHTCNMYAC